MELIYKVAFIIFLLIDAIVYLLLRTLMKITYSWWRFPSLKMFIIIIITIIIYLAQAVTLMGGIQGQGPKSF